MSKTLTCTYIFAELPLEVKLNHRVASIDFTPYSQKEDLQMLYGCSTALVRSIKVDYQNTYQKQLHISNSSFIAEIWGHMIVYRLALWIQQNIKVWPFQKLAKFVAFRSGIADCGEAKVDTNRWVWDMLGPVFFRKYK